MELPTGLEPVQTGFAVRPLIQFRYGSSNKVKAVEERKREEQQTTKSNQI